MAEAVTATIVGVAEVVVVVVAVTAPLVAVAEAEGAAAANAVVGATDATSGPPPATEAAGPSQGAALASRSHPSASSPQGTADDPAAPAEEVLKGGVPGVRQAIDRMNDKATAEGMPKIKREPLVALAEKLAPTLKAAEWRDRAEAAVAGMETVDLRDIRSVVVAADGAARDEETRALAEKLREGLTSRVDAEHNAWRTNCPDHRRGPHGACLAPQQPPAEGRCSASRRHGERLATAASESLTSEVTSDRYATVIDAVAFSPVRPRSRPRGSRQPERRAHQGLTKLAGRIPQIAALFGIEAPAQKPRGKAQAPDAATSAAVGCTCPRRARPGRRRAAAPAADEEE